MIGFWMSAGAMALMVAVVLVQALRRAEAEEPAVNVAVYRDQLAEIDRDLARGTLQAEEAARLRTEVGRRLLEADARAAQAVRTLPVWVPVLGVAAALGLAFLLYFGAFGRSGLGAPGYPDLPLTLRLAEADAAYAARPSQAEMEAARPAWTAPEGSDPQTLVLMDRLRTAVAGRPDDLMGQQLLVQNEDQLGNYAAAARAQDQVLRLLADKATAEDHLRAAELKIYAAGGAISPEAEADLGRVLQADPQNGAARFWIGLMAAQVGRPDRTFQMWEPLLAEGPADAPWIAPIEGKIADIAAAAGIPYTPPATGPSAADVAAAAQMSGEDRQAMIEGMVQGLESRLMAEGGPVEDWVKLVNALGVLGASERKAAALAKAQVQFAADPGALSALKAAGGQP